MRELYDMTGSPAEMARAIRARGLVEVTIDDRPTAYYAAKFEMFDLLEALIMVEPHVLGDLDDELRFLALRVFRAGGSLALFRTVVAADLPALDVFSRGRTLLMHVADSLPHVAALLELGATVYPENLVEALGRPELLRLLMTRAAAEALAEPVGYVYGGAVHLEPYDVYDRPVLSVVDIARRAGDVASLAILRPN